MNFTTSDIDRTVQGIRSIISSNRCSLTSQEIKLLEECIAQLEEAKQLKNSNSLACQNNLIRVAEILLRVFLDENVLQIIEDLFQ